MPISGLCEALTDSAAEVLESMFFTSPAGDAAPEAASGGPWISAALSFRGNPSGRFGVDVRLDTGRRIAASFLGQEEDALTETQAGEVVCELANMICGSVLSRLERESRFELSQPKIGLAGASRPDTPGARRVVELEEGPLAIWLELEEAG